MLTEVCVQPPTIPTAGIGVSATGRVEQSSAVDPLPPAPVHPQDCQPLRHPGSLTGMSVALPHCCPPRHSFQLNFLLSIFPWMSLKRSPPSHLRCSVSLDTQLRSLDSLSLPPRGLTASFIPSPSIFTLMPYWFPQILSPCHPMIKAMAAFSQHSWNTMPRAFGGT